MKCTIERFPLISLIHIENNSKHNFLAQSLNFVQNEVQLFAFQDGKTSEDHAKEVAQIFSFKRRVTNHQSAAVGHLLLNFRGHL